jgi:hypothetical protein
MGGLTRGSSATSLPFTLFMLFARFEAFHLRV